MGIFNDISSTKIGKNKIKKKNFNAFFPILMKWKDIEKNLSPEEKKTEKKFFTYIFFLGVFLFIISSLTPHFQREDVDFWPKGDVDLYLTTDYLTAEVGFFGKSNIPTLGDVKRDEMSEVVRYEVQPGDSLSLIASRFGIRVKTILENNDIKNQNQLKTGTKLYILPVDGILYTIKPGDTLSEIAKNYSVDSEKIKKQNGFKDSSDLIAGETIIIPGGKKLKIVKYIPPVIAKLPKKTPEKISSKPSIKVSKSPLYISPPKQSLPQIKTKKNVWPVRGHGQVTQGYRRGHYAVDIWGPNHPDILAMRAGTVIRASGGCAPRQRGCNSGYGNVIEIDHGGGLVTLYAHNQSFYVKKGQKVVAGQAIAKMGNTGTVYGRTGIHTHFEVRKNGRRVNPFTYIR